MHISSVTFVRKYLTGLFFIICLVVLSVFWGFSLRANQLIRDQLLRQGQAFFQEVVLMREWIADHGGVYVRLRPSMDINPYLLRIPGLKVVIRDAEGNAYTLKNPAVVTREISEIAKKKGILTFKITSLKPLNPSNAPDAFERAALESFETGTKDYHAMEKAGEDLFFRYMAPLLTQESCLQCHGFQGYRVGDVRGGISVTIPATEMVRQVSMNRIYLALLAFGILGVFFAIIHYISHAFIRDINAAEAKLQNMATQDFLTGLINRREALHRLREEISRSARTGSPLTILLIDIDHFKKINDTLGHTAGDSVLQAIAKAFETVLRDYVIVSRYGGEEFLVIASHTDLEQGMLMAERVRKHIETLVIPIGNGSAAGVTVSIGLTQFRAGDTIESLISRADTGLYEAKESGRNKSATIT